MGSSRRLAPRHVTVRSASPARLEAALATELAHIVSCSSQLLALDRSSKAPWAPWWPVYSRSPKRREQEKPGASNRHRLAVGNAPGMREA
jgi:hypothetical protein